MTPMRGLDWPSNAAKKKIHELGRTRHKTVHNSTLRSVAWRCFMGSIPVWRRANFSAHRRSSPNPCLPRTTHYCSTINFTNFSSPPLRSYPELSAQNSGHEYELPLLAFRGGPEMIVIKRARERGGYEKGPDESSNQE